MTSTSDGFGLQAELAQKLRDLTRAIEEVKPRGTALSEAERDYRVALAAKEIDLRASGMPATLIRDVSRGDEDIAALRMRRDMALVLYKSAFEAINGLKYQIKTIENQINREWSNANRM